jgi:uncharacterized repeat protein (TIGR01451 family)
MNSLFSSIKFGSILQSCIVIGGVWVGMGQGAIAQTAITGITATPSIAIPSTIATTGATGGNSSQYATTNNYSLNFGTGTDLVMTSIGVNGINYNTQQIANLIKIRRKDNNFITGERHILLYGRPAPRASTSSTVNLGPSYVNSMEDILLSSVINRGGDNVFANQGEGAGNNNNIERIDILTTQGITAPLSVAKLDKVGFVILDRGGNDSFKIAAITAMDGANNPTTLGNLVSVTATTSPWGASSYPVETTVIRRDGAEQFKPSTDVGSQPISGTFISYTALGVTPGQKIYGYALFPADVIPSMNLITLSNVPLNTPSGNGAGGLDLLAGGLSFAEFPTTDLTITKTDNQTSANPGSSITYTIKVTNNGATPLSSLKVTDALPAALINPTFTPSIGTYNSTTGDWIGLSLNPNQSIELTITATISPSFLGTLTNQATVLPPTGTEDFNPDNNEATDTTVVSSSVLPRIRLVKRITRVANQAIANYIDTVEPDDNAPGWIAPTQTAQLFPGPGTSTNFSSLLQGATNTNNLPTTIQAPKTGDEIEYTIYFLSDGGVNAQNVKLCDFIPANNVYVPGSLQLSQGGSAPVAVIGTTGNFYGNGAIELDTTTGPCKNGTSNNRGGVIVNLGNVPYATGSGTPTASYGYIRFRATVN